MSEIVKTKKDLCTGCNRCVRECPMEAPNITYEDENGNIKVRIDHDKCISCGRCVSACRHEARYFEDDTSLFFADLSKEVPISLIAAPAIRTNIPEYKRLFTYLKRLGVKKIYDVSFGADICIWAHVRHIEKAGFSPLITQPCPSIVKYCEIYQHDLLKYLSPIHSPMGCISVYMKEYDGITDRIAALSPCVAKSDEFEETGLSQYNVTFSGILAYLAENSIQLPDEATEFDNPPGSLGSLFPMPGGLKENLEFFSGRNISIDVEEGYYVYDRLKIYSQLPEEALPQVYDVLNCHDGCNIGAACPHSSSIFEINRMMDKNRGIAVEKCDREYYEDVYGQYDKTLDLSRFMREYQPIITTFNQITDADIENALEMLGKTDYEKQHVDCGACGSDSCRDMARRIALGLNIPTNCMVNVMESAKKEHERLAEMEKKREADERMQVLLDATPLCAHFWDENYNVIDCNLESVKFFNMSSKQEYLKRYRELSPEFQPDGSRSAEKSIEHVKKAFEEGYNRFEWMRKMPDGEPVPVEATLVRVNYKGESLVAAYSRDLREQKQMLQNIYAANAKLDAVISNYPGAIWSVDKNGIITLFNGLYLDKIGVTPSFLEGKNINIARRKGRHLDIIENVQRTIDEGPQDWISEIDGKSFRARTTPIFDEYDEISGVVGSVDDVTDMIELQERLKEQNISMLEQFEMIWDKVESGIVIIDMETREIMGANPAAVRMYGDAQEKMIGEVCYKLFGEHVCPIVDMNQQLDRAERSFFKADGTKIPVLKSVSQIHFMGRPALLESFNDISHMKEAEAQKSMLEMGERMRILLDANPHINILFNSNFDIVDCNSTAIDYMGFETKEEMLAGFRDRLTQSVPDVLSNGRATRPISEWVAAAAKEGEVRFETELILRGGTRSVNVELKRIPYEDSFAIVAYVFDMTEIHEREMELTRARELNELQLVKLNLAAQATKIGLWDMEIVTGDPINPDNAFIWSDEFRHMLGFTDENDFPNVFKSWIDRLHPEDKDAAISAFAGHLLDKSDNTPFDIEYRLLKKDGEYAYFRASGKTIRDEKGNAVRVVGALMDITETKNILLDTEKQRIEAEAANRAKSAFLSTMSHEIRTPMNAILGITEIQIQNEELDNGVREALEKIHVSGDMLLGIINDILDLSKIEAGKLELVDDNYEMASLISDTAQLNMMRIGSKSIEFELFVDENLPAMLSGDELRVKQILNNLLSNAFKYTAAGTVRLSVTKEADSGDNGDTVTLIISVSDTGQGMTKEQVSKLFDEYSRFNMEANRSTEGTGLGMSITRNLVQMMNGRVFVESEPGKGSTFTIYLPQIRVGSDVLGKESADNLHQFRTRSRAQMKRVQIAREPMPYGSVLIVDDVETNIYVAKGLLAPYGLKIDSADSGFAAIEKIKSGYVYDIVFMDHMMPKMDGIEATKIIRGLGYAQPIVALTANAISGQAEIFLGNGFNDFIAKPIDVRQLNTVLNKLIRDRQPPEVLEAARQEKAAIKELPPEAAVKPAIDPKFAEVFIRDAKKTLAVLGEINDKQGLYDEDDIQTYIIHTHGMKSALANIGKMDLSAVALKLETSGRDGNIDIIRAETSTFIESLRAVAEELAIGIKSDYIDERDEDTPYLHERLLEIAEACEIYDEQIIDNALAGLKAKTWSKTTKELLSTISEHLLHSDFDEIANVVNAVIR